MRPTAGEYGEYFDRYISLVTEPDVLAVLNAQASTLHDALSGLSDTRAAHRYADGKWSVREALGHLVDCERMFGFRGLAIARGESVLAGVVRRRCHTRPPPHTTACRSTSSPRSSRPCDAVTC